MEKLKIPKVGYYQVITLNGEEFVIDELLQIPDPRRLKISTSERKGGLTNARYVKVAITVIE